MGCKKRLDLLGASLPETGDRAPPAAPARHAHGQVRERRDAEVAQRARRTRCQPQADVVGDLRLRNRESAQELDRVRDRTVEHPVVGGVLEK